MTKEEKITRGNAGKIERSSAETNLLRLSQDLDIEAEFIHNKTSSRTKGPDFVFSHNFNSPGIEAVIGKKHTDMNFGVTSAAELGIPVPNLQGWRNGLRLEMTGEATDEIVYRKFKENKEMIEEIGKGWEKYYKEFVSSIEYNHILKPEVFHCVLHKNRIQWYTQTGEYKKLIILPEDITELNLYIDPGKKSMEIRNKDTILAKTTLNWRNGGQGIKSPSYPIWIDKSCFKVINKDEVRKMIW